MKEGVCVRRKNMAVAMVEGDVTRRLCAVPLGGKSVKVSERLA